MLETYKMKNFQNKRILITGGASGIGKIMARLFLERNAQVIIWDINQTTIDLTLNEFSSKGSVFGYVVDVSNTAQIKEMSQQMKQNHGFVDVLINNAGIVVGKYFDAHSSDDIDRTLQINAAAPMHVTAAFLEDMLTHNSGHICNIASSAGIVSNPKMSVYAASKWALFGWSDSLRLEMKQLKKNINVTTILPYYINTGMFDGVKSRIPIQNPEAAALTIVKAIEKKKKLITIPGWIYRLTRLSQAIFSINLYDWMMDRVLGVYSTMADFKGRK